MELVALGCMIVVLYTYLGYPLIVGAVASVLRWQPRADPSYEPTVSVCVAAHAGAAHLERKLRDLQNADYPRERLEVLVYSDGATDGTEEVVEKFSAQDPRFRLLRGEKRRGKPSAINALRAAARHEVLLMTDVRPMLDRKSLRALTACLADPTVGCVSGTLVLVGATGAGAYWRYEQFIRSCESRWGSLVGVSGTIYAVRREDMPELPADLLLDDMWVPLTVAMKKRARIALCEDAHAYDTAFEDDREFRRKVRTLAGNLQLLALMPSLLSPSSNPVWFQIVSHKLMRLLCPIALAVLFVCSGLLSLSLDPAGGQVFWATLFAGQTVFYALAAVGERAGSLGRLARTFVVLNAAAVIAFWRFFRRSQQVTW